MIRTYIQVTALLLVLLSSLLLIKGKITLSVESLAELSKSKWGYNLDVAKSLTQERADTIVGFVILLFSLFLQVANMLWPMRWADFATNKNGVILALVTSVIISCIAFVSSNILQQKFYKQVQVKFMVTQKFILNLKAIKGV